MKEPGLDGRHRDQSSPKTGRIDQKRSDAQNGNLSQPIPGFRSDATVKHMREVTGQTSLKGIREAAKRMR